MQLGEVYWEFQQLTQSVSRESTIRLLKRLIYQLENCQTEYPSQQTKVNMLVAELRQCVQGEWFNNTLFTMFDEILDRLHSCLDPTLDDCVDVAIGMAKHNIRRRTRDYRDYYTQHYCVLLRKHGRKAKFVLNEMYIDYFVDKNLERIAYSMSVEY